MNQFSQFSWSNLKRKTHHKPRIGQSLIDLRDRRWESIERCRPRLRRAASKFHTILKIALINPSEKGKVPHRTDPTPKKRLFPLREEAAFLCNESEGLEMTVSGSFEEFCQY